jgi:SAM-dependent methyltransferase
MKTVSIKNRTIWRNMISKITKWAMNLFTGINLTDVTTGFKCFRKELLKLIDLKDIHAEGYAFQIEMSYAARHLGARIKEMPILFLERTAGDSKMSAGIMLEGFVTVLRLSFARLVSRPPLAPDNDAHNQWDRDFIAYFRCRPKKLRKGLAVLKKAGLLARDKDIRILELFCGMGECQQILAQRGYKNIFGLDISYDLIRRAAPGLRLQVANSLNVCYKDNVFDVVLVNEGLHHLKGAGEIRQCFGEVKKVLKKGGLFIFYEPADTIMRRLALKAVFSPIGGFFEKSRLIREILSKEEKEYGYWLKNTGPILKLLMDSGFDIERQFRTFIHMAVISKTADGL